MFRHFVTLPPAHSACRSSRLLGDFTLDSYPPSSEGAPVSPTKAETAANVAKALAEAKQAEANAAKAAAEAEETKARAARARTESKIMKIKLDSILDDKADIDAADDAHLVYRFDEPVSARTVAAAIFTLSRWSRRNPDAPIEVVFTSPGGTIFDGMALFDFLRTLSRRGHHVTTGCLGMAASMAGILLQAGDTRWVGKESLIMIHRASFGVHGQTFEVEDEVEFVKRIEQRIVDIFVGRSGGKLTKRYLRAQWDRRDWWLFSDEALQLGVVDEVR